MSFELIFTSAPRGLRGGQRGFCTVAFTEGMPSNYVTLAEGLSAYRNIYPPHSPEYNKNPVAHSHYQFQVGGQKIHILSRVAPCGTDYSGRNNKLAHHVLMGSTELPPNGPSWFARQSGFFETEWEGDPRLIKHQKALPSSPPPTNVKATHWAMLTGDAGWAGVLAQSHLDSPSKPGYIVFSSGMDVLPLVAEAMALLPPANRWQVTFNTYCTTIPQGTSCLWRCCLPDSPLLRDARRTKATLIDLTDLPKSTVPSPDVTTGPLITAARTGVPPVLPKAQAPAAPSAAPVSPAAPVSARPNLPPSFHGLPSAAAKKKKKIKINYAAAYGTGTPPRAPAKPPARGLFPWWGYLIGFCLLAIVVVTVSFSIFSRQRNTQQEQSTQGNDNTNMPAGTATDDVLPDLDAETNASGAQATSEDKAVTGPIAELTALSKDLETLETTIKSMLAEERMEDAKTHIQLERQKLQDWSSKHSTHMAGKARQRAGKLTDKCRQYLDAATEMVAKAEKAEATKKAKKSSEPPKQAEHRTVFKWIGPTAKHIEWSDLGIEWDDNLRTNISSYGITSDGVSRNGKNLGGTRLSVIAQKSLAADLNFGFAPADHKQHLRLSSGGVDILEGIPQDLVAVILENSNQLTHVLWLAPVELLGSIHVGTLSELKKNKSMKVSFSSNLPPDISLFFSPKRPDSQKLSYECALLGGRPSDHNAVTLKNLSANTMHFTILQDTLEECAAWANRGPLKWSEPTQDDKANHNDDANQIKELKGSDLQKALRKLIMAYEKAGDDEGGNIEKRLDELRNVTKTALKKNSKCWDWKSKKDKKRKEWKKPFPIKDRKGFFDAAIKESPETFKHEACLDAIKRLATRPIPVQAKASESETSPSKSEDIVMDHVDVMHEGHVLLRIRNTTQ